MSFWLCGWKVARCLQVLMAFTPLGSVSRKMPQLHHVSLINPSRRRLGDVRWIMLRRTNDGDALRHHHLICAVGVQIHTAHEATLSRVSMNPSQHHEVLSIDVVEQAFLIRSPAGIACSFLVRDDESVDEECILFEETAEDTAGLEVAPGVWGGYLKKLCADAFREEDGA